MLPHRVLCNRLICVRDKQAPYFLTYRLVSVPWKSFLSFIFMVSPFPTKVPSTQSLPRPPWKRPTSPRPYTAHYQASELSQTSLEHSAQCCCLSSKCQSRPRFQSVLSSCSILLFSYPTIIKYHKYLRCQAQVVKKVMSTSLFSQPTSKHTSNQILMALNVRCCSITLKYV